MKQQTPTHKISDRPETGFHAREAIGIWITYYNEQRPHSHFDGDRTPMEVYIEAMAA